MYLSTAASSMRALDSTARCSIRNRFNSRSAEVFEEVAAHQLLSERHKNPLLPTGG
jgi:hypothetical protein